MCSEWFYFKSDGKNDHFPASHFPDIALGLCSCTHSNIVLFYIRVTMGLCFIFTRGLFFYWNGAALKELEGIYSSTAWEDETHTQFRIHFSLGFTVFLGNKIQFIPKRCFTYNLGLDLFQEIEKTKIQVQWGFGKRLESVICGTIQRGCFQ